ncbi:MAG: NrfD/PsrC family molybdoenzyme membrane anchor subunit, partial [Terriglobia bacterium]
MADPQPRANDEQLERDLLRPIRVTGPRFKLALAGLGLLMGGALFAWGWQVYRGMGVAGINQPQYWGVYIINFVFWIGISHAGTLISAILRVTHARWRYPITRAAEAITVFALMIGPVFILIHLGRSWLFYWIIPYPNERGVWPNFRSPLLWDFTCITAYLLGSLTYLYLPMIPDLALLRDRTRGGRRRLYRWLALGWQGTERQWARLEKAIS